MARELREIIVKYVVQNWEVFFIMSYDNEGNNYTSSAHYLAHTSQPFTYGDLCELVAAGQLFNFVSEVAMVYFTRVLVQ